ncbi:MAG TPA: twin-arginine translocation signal domain-containing protein, partial [Nitrososphaerales archaeon]|nr:twin-arginine translocation signal domain-containing protein [Nitrososphaerales archaeon]
MPEESRRRFLKYGGLAAVGAAAAALGYFYLSPGGQRTVTQTTGTGTTSSGTYDPGNVPPDYAEFLTWLHAAARPYAGKTMNVSLENEPTPVATQVIDSDFFKATSINNSYSIKPYYLHLSDLSLMVNTMAPTYDVFDVDHQDIAQFKDHIMSPAVLAETYPDLTFAPISSSDYADLAWSLVGEYPPNVPEVGGSQSSGPYFIPYDMDATVQFYRTDEYQAMGLTPATTWDE